MTYFSNSAWEYIAEKISRVRRNRAGSRMLVTVPRLREKDLLDLADTFTGHCLAENIHLDLKIADVIWSEWASAAQALADKHNWLDHTGSLTSSRNLWPTPGPTNLVVLCGTDYVTDAGSLSDFDCCDPETVWTSHMNRSYAGWVSEKLSSIGVECERAELREFDRLLVPLMDHGKADLLQISTWLAELDLNSVTTVREAQEVMLFRMDVFNLPKFTTFPLARKKVSLGPYIEKANAFFSYTMFLEAREREKAQKAIDKILEVMDSGEDIGFQLDDESIRGPYTSDREFLEGLRNYILTENRSEHARLMACDFVTIVDKILKFRKKAEPKEKQTIRKLSGSPIEVILHGIWDTFREFYRDKRTADLRIDGIRVTADRFKHDYENSTEGEQADSVADRTELARQHLFRLIGGVDRLINTRIALPGAFGDNLAITCKLEDEDISCVYGKTAEPQLEFTVCLMHGADEAGFSRKYAWRLPEIQSSRIAEALIRWAKNSVNADGHVWRLPVFHLPYYEELLRAVDDEETRRITLHCIKDPHLDAPRMTNLLTKEWIKTNDPLLSYLKALAEKYSKFLNAAFERGLFDAQFSDEWIELRQAYAAACRAVIDQPDGMESQMASMLLRSFLIVRQRDPETGAAWITESFERSGIATVLHPSVLEMLEAQVLFLFSCFNAAVQLEMRRDDRKRAFADNIWNGYVDLAGIQSPIVGLLHNEDLNLDTNVRGADLIHRIGSPLETEASLSTRLLVRYENGVDDEEVTDSDMFRESRESKLLFRLMADYFRLHPQARDGLSLAVFRNKDIQPVIAAVHQYLTKLADARDPRYYVLSPDRRKPYAIGVTVFTESGDDIGVARWIEQWRERWEAAETESKFRIYRCCRFSVAHRIVEARQLPAFQRLIKDSFEADIAVVYDFIGAGQGGNRFAEVIPFDMTARTLKFPILEKTCCVVKHPTDSYKRSRVISNRQFILGSLHSQVTHRLKSPGVQPGKEFAVLGIGDFSPWRGVIDALHEKTEWVICIDPSMDERLIKVSAGERPREREIIGFGSGVGLHGEANFTISTELFSLADVKVRLSAAIQEVYSNAGWSNNDYQLVTECVLRQARELSGLSLVRATGVGNYIRDFMAYSLSRKMLQETGDGILCDNLISLDAYRHWFDLADNERRPDLLWLTAWIGPDGRVALKARLIECKVAQEADEHLQRARAQINNGLRVLVPAFAPRSCSGDDGTDDNRPDQRYWWLQLHRLVTSKSEIDNNSEKKVLAAMEQLAEGDYTIEWDAAVFAFWSDDPSDKLRRIGQWKAPDIDDLSVNIYSMGNGFVRELAIDGSAYPKTWIDWKNDADKELANVCDSLDDIELPPGDEDDEDLPTWDNTEQDVDDGDESEPVEDENTPESDQTEPTPSEVVIETETMDQPIQTNTPQATVPSNSESSPDKAQVAVEVSTPNIPKRILLGETVGGGKKVYWEFGHSDLANRHMVIFGMSGMGKTYAIQTLLCELGREGQNSLIIDYTDGFIPSKLEQATIEYLDPRQHFIQQSPLPINPFKAQVSHEAGYTFKDTPITIAKRVSSIFKSVYELGNQQFPVLIDAIQDGVQNHGDELKLSDVLGILQSYINDGIHSKSSVITVMSKLKQFVTSNPFSEAESGIGWDMLFNDSASRCHVFQFHMLDKHTSRAVIEFVLWDLYSFVTSCGSKHIPRVVILDEVQNLDLGPDAPVAKYLTEGRKHGLALVTATQTVRGVGGVSDARVSRLFQAEHKLFFKPTENEMREHAQLLHNAISSVSVQDWASRLASLQVGECWSLGRSLNENTDKLTFQAQRVRICSMEKRGFNV